MVDLPFFVCVCCFALRLGQQTHFPCNSGFFFKRGAIIADTDKGFPAIREMFLLVSPPPRPFSKTTLGLSFSLFSSVFHFNIVIFHQPLSRCYFCFVSLALSLLPLSFLRFCFVPSNQFPAIPFSNPPCFHFRSFRSSILPLCTLLFSGLAFPSFLFVLVFVWFSSDCFCHLFFITGSRILCFSFCCLWLCTCGEGCFGFSPRLFFRTTLDLSFSLMFVSFSVFHFNIPRFFFFHEPNF